MNQITANDFLEVFDQTNECLFRVNFDPPVPLHLSEDEQVEMVFQYGNVTYMNNALANAYGYKRLDPFPSISLEQILPRELPSSAPVIRKVVQSDFNLIDFETIEKDVNGDTLTFSNTIVGKGNDGYISEIWGICRETTESNKLKGDHSLRLAALDAANEGCIIVDATDKNLPIIYANRGYLKLCGYEMHEIIGKNPRFIQGPDTDSKMIKTIGVAIRERRSFKAEILNYRKNGEAFWNELSISPVRKEQGQVTHYIGIMNDVTVNKKNRRSLRQKASILDSTHDCVISTTPDGVIKSWNKQAENVYGYTNDEAIGQHISMCFFTEDVPILEDFLSRQLASREILHESMRNRNKSGDTLIMDFRLSLERNTKGSPVGVIICSNDITSITESNNRIQELQSELAHFARTTVFNELSSSLAHELNQPLAANLNNAQAALRMLEYPNPDLEEIREILSDIVSDNRRAGKIVNRLRSMTKKSSPQIERYCFNSILRETSTLMRSEFIIKNIEFETEFQEDLPPITCDKIQVQQVIINLLKNASDAIYDSNSTQRTIRVTTCAVSNEQIQCEILDSGPGVPKDKLRTIFDPFYTTKEDGMGMGLSICHSIIQNHNGSITVQSDGASDTIFTIQLPIAN